jgi:TonB family protein
MTDLIGARSHTIAGCRDFEYERDDMSEAWKRWEGRTVDGRFPLQRYLGGSGHSAVFLTVTQPSGSDSEKAAIKLIPADAVDAKHQFLRWKAASELTHPNLIRIFEAGRCELDGTELLYVVMEYAEENLSQILPERALTAEEARGMLAPILRALQFVHDKGFVHGHIRPSNILAVADQVKLSSDTLSVPGERNGGARATNAYDPPEAATGAISAAADVWQLGMTLVEVLTQHLPVWDRARMNAPRVPVAVPEPFREIAGHCLQVDAGKRWTVGEILHRVEADRVEAARRGSERVEPAGPALRSSQPEKAASATASAAQRKEFTKWPYWLGLAAVVVVAFFLIARPKTSSPPAEQQSTQAEPGAAAEGAQPAQTSTSQEPNTNASHDNQNDVVRQVMPQVSPSARRTIQGTIKVRVRVDVDAAGNVAKAKLEVSGPSKYFSRVAMEAAREWKFVPAGADESGAREWKVQFAFSRAKTEVSAVRAKR